MGKPLRLANPKNQISLIRPRTPGESPLPSKCAQPLSAYPPESQCAPPSLFHPFRMLAASPSPVVLFPAIQCRPNPSPRVTVFPPRPAFSRIMSTRPRLLRAGFVSGACGVGELTLAAASPSPDRPTKGFWPMLSPPSVRMRSGWFIGRKDAQNRLVSWRGALARVRGHS